MPIFHWINLLLLVATAAAGTAFAESQPPSGQRMALLIGNADYPGLTLPGAGKSLDTVEKALVAQGFTVVRHNNLKSKDDQKGALQTFVNSVPTNGIALVYYFGLGGHLERLGKFHNLLRPAGEEIKNENDFRSAGLDVAELEKSLREQSGARTSLIFLDASWEFPAGLTPEKVRGGMLEMESEAGSVIFFAAGSGVTLPLPDKDTPSALATALARNTPLFDTSIRDACAAIAAESGGKPWFSQADPSGIGTRPPFPSVASPDLASTPGDTFVNAHGIVFQWCPQGSFTMGSDRTEDAATRDRTPVPVTISRGFWLGTHEVTQREFQTVMKKNPPADFTTHKNAPHWGVTEAKSVLEFAKSLTAREREAGKLPDGWEYTCPTEAEWEYACRAGSPSAYFFGDSIADLGRYANFADKSLKETNPDFHWADPTSSDGVADALAPAGSYFPNAWGLRDMHGNVAEIVADQYLPDLPGGTDPLATVEKDGRTVIRGGAWCSLPSYCESSFRNSTSGRNKPNFIGFRLALKKTK